MKNFFIKLGKVTLGTLGLLVTIITLVNEGHKLISWVSTAIRKIKKKGCSC